MDTRNLPNPVILAAQIFEYPCKIHDPFEVVEKN